MVITSFGILVYSVFTIVAGCLNDNSYEPPELVVVNGLAELLQVRTNKRQIDKRHCPFLLILGLYFSCYVILKYSFYLGKHSVVVHCGFKTKTGSWR